jgi:AAA+ superfamily predicted ATPase
MLWANYSLGDAEDTKKLDKYLMSSWSREHEMFTEKAAYDILYYGASGTFRISKRMQGINQFHRIRKM